MVNVCVSVALVWIMMVLVYLFHKRIMCVFPVYGIVLELAMAEMLCMVAVFMLAFILHLHALRAMPPAFRIILDRPTA